MLHIFVLRKVHTQKDIQVKRHICNLNVEAGFSVYKSVSKKKFIERNSAKVQHYHFDGKEGKKMIRSVEK